MKERKIIFKKLTNEMINSFEKDFSDVFKLDKEKALFKILFKIKNNLKINKIPLFHSKCEFNQCFIYPPGRDYIFLYKKNVKKLDFIAIFYSKNESKIYRLKIVEISTGKELQNFLNIIDESCKYFYCLHMEKIDIKGRKRKLNEIKRYNYN